MARFAALAVALVLLGACGKSAATAPPTTALPAVIAVGPDPSISAKMICAPETANTIATALGARPIRTPVATWVDHVYSCRYVFAGGAMTLSVKELSRASETTAYFDQLAQTYGKRSTLQLGQGGFIANDDSAIVRKDYKVLRVDVTRLPAQFGRPPSPRSTFAADVAITVLGCWTGA
jgi:hypothetical protein